MTFVLVVCNAYVFLSRQVLLAVCRTFLCPSFSEQVAQFLLPAMAYGKYPFPFVELIQALITHASQSHSSADMSFSTASRSASSSYISSNANAVMPSPWLLLSILTLGQNKLGEYSVFLDKFNSVHKIFEFADFTVFKWHISLHCKEIYGCLLN